MRDNYWVQLLKDVGRTAALTATSVVVTGFVGAAVGSVVAGPAGAAVGAKIGAMTGAALGGNGISV